MRRTGALIIVLFVVTAARPVRLFAEDPKSAHCAGPKYRKFDFWIGDWDAYDFDQPAKIIARNRVDPILGGCVLLENYQAASGSIGESFTIYDASRNVWHQTWVTDMGKLLVIEGGMKNGEMILTGVDPIPGGRERLVRGIWKPIEGGVRETAVTSIDGGKTWNSWFDIVFRPHR